MRRIAATLVCSLMLLGGLYADPAGAVNPPTGSVTWLSTGDSYSSGHGVPGNSGLCAQSAGAWGLAAVNELLAGHRWAIDKPVFSACTGHRVSDFYNRRAGSDSKGSLWEWTKEQSGATDPKFDVITLSFGGNDVDFPGVINNCVLVGVCQTSEGDLLDRVTQLNSPNRFIIDDGGPGGTGHATTGSIADFYQTIARRHLTPRGRLVVMGYPRLYAPAGEWPAWTWAMCNYVTRGSADMLGRVGEALDTTLASAASGASRAVGGRIDYVSAVDLWGGRNTARTGQGHEQCGAGEDWMNGPVSVAGTLTDAKSGLQLGSVHPNLVGHAAEGKAVAELLSAKSLIEPPKPTTTTKPQPEPVLGADGWATGVEGFGRARPRRIFYGGSPSGLVDNVRWTSWGGEKAEGDGTAINEANSPDGTVASAPSERAHVVAWQLGTCKGKRAYLKVGWYFEGQRWSATDESYDICEGR